MTKERVAEMAVRLRCLHAALQLKQPSPEAAAAMKRIAKAEVVAYEVALRECGTD